MKKTGWMCFLCQLTKVNKKKNFLIAEQAGFRPIQRAVPAKKNNIDVQGLGSQNLVHVDTDAG